MAQKKPSGKPIKITLTEAQISDIIQRAAKTRRSIRVESLEDRIAPSRIGLPIFGGAEDADVPGAPAPGSLPGEEFPEGGLPGEIFPEDGPSTDGDTGFEPKDPFVPGGDPNDGLIDPTGGEPGDGVIDPTDPNNGLIDPNNNPDDGLIPPPVDPDGGVLAPETDPSADLVDQASVDEAANVEFNENLHLQGDAPDSGLTAEEMEEHRLNILRQLRG